MFARAKKYVSGKKRMAVQERDRLRIFKNEMRGKGAVDDLAEYAFRYVHDQHGRPPADLVDESDAIDCSDLVHFEVQFATGIDIEGGRELGAPGDFVVAIGEAGMHDLA